MNWATIAPETRLYKGKNLYRWDDSPGLEHHCGVCATPLHNSRAKTSCIGKHVEPCYRFHQQLHFVGKSHECFGCNSSDEMHHNRHKDILRIVRQINTIDQVCSVLTPTRDNFAKPRTTSANITLSTTSTDTASESQESLEDNKLTRRERKKAKKAGNNSVKDKKGMEVFPQEEIDFISEAIHLTVHESKGAWEGTYVYDHKAATTSGTKIPDVEEEAIVDEEGEYSPETQANYTYVDDMAVKSPMDMTPRQRRVHKKYNTAINHSSFSGGSRKFISPRSNLYDGVDPDVFSRLNVEIMNPLSSSRERKDLVAKLVAAVKEDIEIIKREDDDSLMREEGFWRWAGRNAFHHITETRKGLDWATGQKINPRFEFPDAGEMDGVEVEGEGQVIDDFTEVVPQPKPPAKAKEVDDGFIVVEAKNKGAAATGKKPKPKSFITISSNASRRALKAPAGLSSILNAQTINEEKGDDEANEEEETGEDFAEMIRRSRQKLAGKGVLGAWQTPLPPFIPLRARRSKVKNTEW